MFSLQLEASPICHLALEKSITYLNKGDLFEYVSFSCTFILLHLIIMKRLLLKLINVDHFHLLCYMYSLFMGNRK